MTTPTDNAITSSSETREQSESTLFIPSMYSEDETDSSGEVINSRYALQRCLAWSQDEAEDEFMVVDDPSLSFCSAQSTLIDKYTQMDEIPMTTARNIHWEDKVKSGENLEQMMKETINAIE